MAYRPTSLLSLFASATLIALPSAACADELITNGNFSAGATGFGTTYDQTDANGYLFITTNPDSLGCGGCFPSMGDHTTGTGNMLFVDGAAVGDGATPASHPYYTVTLGVAPGADYTFSYFAVNLGNGGPNPVLASYLNGILLGPATTPTYAQWTPYSFMFNSGALSSVTLSLSDLTQTHSYNDFAIDDVSLLGPLPGTPRGVPEPSTWVMMLLGFGAIGFTTRRQLKPQIA
jgi:hypothetical protein